MQSLARFFLAAAASGVLFSSCPLAASAPDAPSAPQTQTFETRLDNGMKVIVREDRRAPSVVHMVWYGVGSMDEPPGLTGISHMLEHAMFKGTANIPAGEFSRRIAQMGGRENAFTSHDYTAYFQQIPPAELGKAMALEADRMSNLQVSDELFLPERDVVAEERRMRTEDNPHALLFEQLMATAYQSHPYHHPIIGWMDDIRHYTAQAALDWYRTWYAPNNATLVVVGDVAHADVFALARQHYGATKSRPLPTRRVQEEAPQRGAREVRVRAPATLPVLYLAWPAPVIRDVHDAKDAYALEMLAAILDGSEGARLPRKLVRATGMAVSASTHYSNISRGPGLFIFSAAPTPEHNTEELARAFLDEIAEIAENGVSAEELQRALTQATAQQVYKRDSLMGQAMEIGVLESTGHRWQDDAALLAGLARVTSEDVQAVARRYFSPEQMNRAELIPDQEVAGKTPQS